MNQEATSSESNKFTDERYEKLVATFVTYIMENQGFNICVPYLPPKLAALDQLSSEDIYRIRLKVWERTQDLLQLMGLEYHASHFNLSIRVKETR